MDLKPPVEDNSKGKLWKLNKCVYGLCDASRHWYLKVHNVMIEHGAQVPNLVVIPYCLQMTGDVCHLNLANKKDPKDCKKHYYC